MHGLLEISRHRVVKSSYHHHHHHHHHHHLYHHDRHHPSLVVCHVLPAMELEGFGFGYIPNPTGGEALPLSLEESHYRIQTLEDLVRRLVGRCQNMGLTA